MKSLSVKREKAISIIFAAGTVSQAGVGDDRSIKWLEKNGYITISPFVRNCQLTVKGLDYLKSRPAF